MSKIRFLSMAVAIATVGLAFAIPPPAAASGGPKTGPIVGKSTTTIAPSLAALGVKRPVVLVLTEPTALVGNERLLARGSSKNEPTVVTENGLLRHPISPLARAANQAFPGEGHTAKADGGTELIDGGFILASTDGGVITRSPIDTRI
ncbi:MAG TPA: hypothetical protein VHP58_04940 [Alphaproteobacteria bacterium]|nr:hypothetical protein [Alphaproteobacteria bacterium]